MDIDILSINKISIVCEEYTYFKLAIMQMFNMDQHHVLVEIRTDDLGRVGPHVRLLTFDADAHPGWEASIEAFQRQTMKRILYRAGVLDSYESEFKSSDTLEVN